MGVEPKIPDSRADDLPSELQKHLLHPGTGSCSSSVAHLNFMLRCNSVLTGNHIRSSVKAENNEEEAIEQSFVLGHSKDEVTSYRHCSLKQCMRHWI